MRSSRRVGFGEGAPQSLGEVDRPARAEIEVGGLPLRRQSDHGADAVVVLEAIVSEDDRWPTDAATKVAHGRLSHHAYSGHGGCVAASGREQLPRPARVVAAWQIGGTLPHRPCG
jgi:hypothetical protein